MINSKKLSGINSTLQLSGASICVQAGTTTELNMADYFRANKMDYNPVVFEKLEEANAAYDSGRCDAYTTDQSGLYSTRLTLANQTITLFCRKSSPKSRLDQPFVRVIPNGQTLFAGHTMRC